jgi:hypothetical protein
MRKDIRRGLCGLVLAAGTATSGFSAAGAAETAPWNRTAVHHQVLRAAAPATARDVRIATWEVANGVAGTVVPGSPALREEVARPGPVPPMSSPTLTGLILLLALVGAGCATGGPGAADRERTPART